MTRDRAAARALGLAALLAAGTSCEALRVYATYRRVLAHERAHVIPDRVLRDVELTRVRRDPSLPAVGHLPRPAPFEGAAPRPIAATA